MPLLVMRHIQDFHRKFKTDDQCLRYLFELRSGDVTCPKCERRNAYYCHSKKQCYTCTCGGHHIYPRVGTVFAHSSLPLHKWFFGVFLMHRSNGSITARKLEQELKIAYGTAWRIKTKINTVMSEMRQEGGRSSFELLLLYCSDAPC